MNFDKYLIGKKKKENRQLYDIKDIYDIKVHNNLDELINKIKRMIRITSYPQKLNYLKRLKEITRYNDLNFKKEEVVNLYQDLLQITEDKQKYDIRDNYEYKRETMQELAGAVDKKIIKAEEKDIWEVTEGIPLGSGYIAHKDKNTNEIYVLDKEGNEVKRLPNAFSQDLAQIIEFFRVLLDLPVEKKEEDNKTQKNVELEPENEESEKENEESEKENSLREEMEKMLNEKEGNKQEISPDDKKLAELKQQIDEKKKKVEEILTYLIDEDRIVSKEEIKNMIVAGENPIFAKERAIEEKIKKLRKIFMAANDDMLETFKETLKIEPKENTNNIINELFEK